MKNSKLISAVVAVGAIFGVGAAQAADLPMRAAPYVAPPPVFSWTGCYVGVHAGAGIMVDSVESSSRQMEAVGSNYTGSGGLAGGQAGCNYQDGNWVFGVEGEGWWSGIKTKDASSSLDFQDTEIAKNKYDYSIAARAGIAFDRTLVYGKAGWAWGRFDILDSSISSCCSNNGGPRLETFASSGNLNGLLLGVGIEHALTQNWTVKLEYNYLRYGAKAFGFVACDNDSTPPCVTGTSTFQADKHIFKIGANYLFN